MWKEGHKQDQKQCLVWVDQPKQKKPSLGRSTQTVHELYNVTYHGSIDGFRAPKDIEDAVPSPRQRPHHLQVKVHPQLIRSIVGVFGLIVKALVCTPSLQNLEQFVHSGYGVVLHLQQLRFIHEVQTQHRGPQSFPPFNCVLV